MFKKILVANRGEIALRIVRACNEMGIAPVAIYSEADQFSLHVKRASHAHCLSKKPLEAYLNGQRIIECAHATGCEAIHPGYGFLSENAEFAHKVVNNNITWIGPSPEMVHIMGNKIEARKTMQSIGIPIIPGFHGPDSSEHSKNLAKNYAAQIGYPIILKASLGGGGKALKKITHEQEFDLIWNQTKIEAKNFFGSEEIFIEKFLTGRHIEIQVAGDGKDAIHLYERECSIQRRNQKMIEEAPCRFVSKNTLEKMYSISVSAMKQLGYDHIGTIEFIVTPEEDFYFLEMNTRLQVEHTVTEQTTGIDLVWLQLEITKNKKLPLIQNDIIQRGHAIECRILSEDPYNNFIPSTGTISHISFPHSPFIRHEHALEVGNEITSNFDSMISKVISYGYTRKMSIKNIINALQNFSIAGIKTNITFLINILLHQQFNNGTFSTGWLEQNIKHLTTSLDTLEEAAIISTLLLEQLPKKEINSQSKTGWKNLSWR